MKIYKIWSFYSDFSCIFSFSILLPMYILLFCEFYLFLLYYKLLSPVSLCSAFISYLTFPIHSSLYLMYCYILIVPMMLTVTPSHDSEMNEILIRIYLEELFWYLLCPSSDSKKNSKPLLCRTLLKKYNKLFLVESATVVYLVIKDSTGWTRNGGL